MRWTKSFLLQKVRLGFLLSKSRTVLHAQITKQCDSQSMYCTFYTLVWQVLISSEHYFYQLTFALKLRDLFLIIYCTYEDLRCIYIRARSCWVKHTYTHLPLFILLQIVSLKTRLKVVFFRQCVTGELGWIQSSNLLDLDKTLLHKPGLFQN